MFHLFIFFFHRNGKVWWDLRQKLKEEIFPRKKAESFIPTVDGIVRDFISNCETECQIDDIFPVFQNVFLESKF